MEKTFEITEDKLISAMDYSEASEADIDARIRMLGIAEEEMKPGVYFALSALLEKLDDTNRELSR